MDNEIIALRAELSELQARLAALADDGGRGRLEQPGGRRALLKLAGAAAVGAAAAGVAGARPAAATTGDEFLVGKNNFADVTTSLTYGSGPAEDASPGGASPAPLLFVNASDQPDSVAVMASGKRIGVLGSGAYAGVSSFGLDYAYVAVVSKKADFKFALLEAISNAPKTAPPSRTDAHQKGELDVDGNGNLWFCVADGTPGTWRKLTGSGAGGTFHPLSPGRVYDSREAAPSPGELASGQNRTISVADRRNVAGGSVASANFVPAGATAVSANVTIVSTAGSGFLAINPGGDLAVKASTINWSAPGQILANGVTLTINANRQLAVIAGGGGATHFVVDILGYWR